MILFYFSQSFSLFTEIMLIFGFFRHIFFKNIPKKAGGEEAGDGKPDHEKRRHQCGKDRSDHVNHKDCDGHKQIAHAHDKGMGHNFFKRNMKIRQQRKQIKDR